MQNIQTSNKSNKPKTIIKILLSLFITAFLTVGIVSAATTIGANISTAGNATLGDAATDVITANGYFTQVRIGTGETFGHIGTVGADELGVEGQIEIDGTAWFDGSLRASSTLQATGAARLYATLTVDGETVGEYFTATSTTATTTLAGGLNVGSGGLVYDLNDGRVRVDTTLDAESPSVKSKLEVYNSSGPQLRLWGWADSDTGANAHSAKIILGTNSASAGSIVYGYNNDSSLYIENLAIGTDNDIKFRVYSGTVNALTIKGITGNVGIGTTTPNVPLQVATSSPNATTTIEIGKTGQNKGSCLKLYDVAGSAYYCSIQGGTFSCSTGSCE